MKISNLEITEFFEEQSSSGTPILRRIEATITVSTLYSSGLNVENVNIIHMWLKGKMFTLVGKSLTMSTLCTSG
jgi:hypothetical protein